MGCICWVVMAFASAAWGGTCGIPEFGAVCGDRLVLSNGCERCVVETQGARVLSYEVGGRELLWMPDEAPGSPAVWRHGGIPIAWPWFGRIGKGDEHIHGYAWRSPFAVKSRSADGVVLSLETESAALEYSIRLGDGLHLVLTTTNRSSFEIPVGMAFHPYFRVGERDRTTVGGVGPTEIAVTNSVDEGENFAAAESRREYVVADGERRLAICLEVENSTGVNLWNPGPEKRCPGVIPGDGWRRFVSVEPYATGANRFFVLGRGETRDLRMSVRCRLPPGTGL